ncbi:nucleotidyltransferase [Cohnella pontilimi]|uniref:tRNA(Met) cytidine acetate ligase n=1 Tax=Cohnella pontilimi TaxID=2564100 RepID=A0A4U0FEK9_9BACL|nr:nucleotidyltransferase [Cohnella pontilimi]TJY43230.1 nucleotidyltransferase [Cohnella pontilimi]
MRTVGVIVEYNPLHNGHLYHLQQSKKITGADAAVAVMSGHFLQRGEPALADKWARAEMALRAGCDLVLELPVAYSAQAAQWFAYGAVAVLDATGVVDTLCFGSESGDLQALDSAAEALTDEPGELAERLSALLKEGRPYPAAYTAAAQQLLAARGRAELAFALEQPNHTLGLHYLIALRQLGSRIAPFTIRREKSGYAQSDITDAAIASATALRRLLTVSGSWEELAPYVPATTLAILVREAQAGRAPVDWESFARPLFHELLRSDAAELSTFAEVTEGLEHRIRRIFEDLGDFKVGALLDRLKTKRYTRTKLQRTLLRILLGHRKQQLTPEKLASGVEYIRVLGFTPKGRELLHLMRQSASVPVITSAARGHWAFLELDARASAIYALAFRHPDPAAALRDYKQPPVMIL